MQDAISTLVSATQADAAGDAALAITLYGRGIAKMEALMDGVDDNTKIQLKNKQMEYKARIIELQADQISQNGNIAAALTGNEFACPVDVLKKPEELTDEERKACIDDGAVPQAVAGG